MLYDQWVGSLAHVVSALREQFFGTVFETMDTLTDLFIIITVMLWVLTTVRLLSFRDLVTVDADEYIGDFSDTTDLINMSQNVTGFTLFLVWLRILFFLRYIAVLGPMVRAVILSLFAEQVLTFLAFFTGFAIAFSLWEFVTYGSSFDIFRNLAVSSFTGFMQQLGDLDAFEDMMGSRGTNAFFAWLVMAVIGAITLNNIFIAVVSDVFAEFLANSEQDWQDDIICLLAKDLLDRWPNAARIARAKIKEEQEKNGGDKKVHCCEYQQNVLNQSWNRLGEFFKVSCEWLRRCCKRNTDIITNFEPEKDKTNPIEKVKDVMRNLKDVLFEMDQRVRVQQYRSAFVIACHDDGTYDLSYDGIVEYNVPAKFIRLPGSGDAGLRKKKALYQKGDPVEGPIGWGSTLDVQLPQSIKELHITQNMAAFNLAEPSKIAALTVPLLCDIHPLAIKNYKDMHDDEESEQVEVAAAEKADEDNPAALAQLKEQNEANQKGREALEKAPEMEKRLRETEARALLEEARAKEAVEKAAELENRLRESEVRLDEARELFKRNS